MSPGFSRLVGYSICHKNYDPDDDAEPGGDDVNEVHTGYIIYHAHKLYSSILYRSCSWTTIRPNDHLHMVSDAPAEIYHHHRRAVVLLKGSLNISPKSFLNPWHKLNFGPQLTPSWPILWTIRTWEKLYLISACIYRIDPHRYIFVK